MVRTVILNYFKPKSGKWYAEGKYQTNEDTMFRIQDEVRRIAKAARLPGLIPGHSNFIVHIECPEHQYNIPKLIIPEETVTE